MSVIKGSQVVEAMGAEIKEQVEKLNAAGVEPCLAILRVGADGSQIAYEKGAKKRMEANGIKCLLTELAEEITQS